MTKGVQALRLDDIDPSPTNPRKVFDEAALADLAESIKEHGIIQPIVVRPLEEIVETDSNRQPAVLRYELVAGERRMRAARLAGLDHIPAIIQRLTDSVAAELQLVENLQREGLHPLDEAEGYTRLLKAGHSPARVAERVGRSVNYLHERLRLMTLIKPAAELFRAGKILAGHAVLLARLSPETQKRVITPTHGILFQREALLWDPEAKGRAMDSVKACTVGELQAWIDKHVRFDPDSQLDLGLVFPKTASVVAEAREHTEKIVSITYDYCTLPEARDGSRVYSCRSWKRADGSFGGKACDRSVTGVVVIGPRRGEAFKVCIDKKRCKVHWAAEMREAKKRAESVAKGGTKGEDRYAAEQRKHEEQRKREEAERARWNKAVPEILKAVAIAVKKSPVKATGILADLLIDRCAPHYGWSKSKTEAFVKQGKTAEDLVRFLAFIRLDMLANDWRAPCEFPKMARRFGVDTRAIVNRIAPAVAETPTPEASGKAKPSIKRSKATA